MFIRVTKSPIELAEDFPLDQSTIEAIRFTDQRSRDHVDMIRDLSWELAQYMSYAERLENRLKKYETVEEFNPTPYVHVNVEL